MGHFSFGLDAHEYTDHDRYEHANRNSDVDRYANGYPNSNGDADRDRHRNRYTGRDGNARLNSYGDSYEYAN